ncbi:MULTISPECIES: hypothetical protein [Serratia]|uniref:hypothetical protein n=1 Tax=Serratia TaxID=613 RepID=UPI001EFB5586|nr:hypothetical protein [Serratia sp. 506_PEND]
MIEQDLTSVQPGALLQPTSKIHRHHEPVFCGSLPNIVPVKRFAAALKQHDWNRNPHIYKLRCQRGQRLSVRSERRETADVLALAFVANCDYSPDSDYLFEVMCGVEDLAKQCGQLHVNTNGRKTYDPILNTIRDWKDAGVIVVLKGQDPDTRQQKAMRIWLKPEFFEMLGFSISELREIVTKLRRWMERKGLRDTWKERYAKHVMRLARSNVASIEDKHSLKNLLKKIKRLVLGDDARIQDEQQQLVSELEKKLRETEQALGEQPKDERKYWAIYSRWKAQQPMAVSMKLERAISQENPGIIGEALHRLYVERIRRDGL